MVRKWLLLGLVLAGSCLLITGWAAVGAGVASGTLEEADKLFEEEQYGEAEKGYLEIASKGSADALAAQRQLGLLYIATGEMPKADTAYEQLLKRFGGQEGFSQALWAVARGYGGAGEKAKALAINKYNVEHHPDDKYGMWSQVEIAYSHIRDGEEAEADEAVVKLLNTFSGQEGLPKEIHQIGRAYGKAKRNDKALELYRYNVEYFPQDKYAMWSQVESVYCHVQDGNDTAADEAVDKLIEVFSGQPTFPKELYQVAMKYRSPKTKKRVLELHEYNVEHYPDYNDVHAMWSQTEIAKFHIRDGNDPAAEQAYQKLLTVFSGKATLPKEVCIVGDVYCQEGNCDRATQIYQYVMGRWPGSEHLIWARAGMAKVDIVLGEEDNAKAKTDGLVADFKGNPALVEAVGSIAEAYWSRSLALERQGYLGALSSLMLSDRKSAEAVRGLPDQLMTDGARQWKKLGESEKNERIEDQKRRLYRALSEWDRIMNELPEDPRHTAAAYYWSGNAHRKLGDYEKAVEFYETLLEKWPDFESSWNAQYRVIPCYEHLVQMKVISMDEGALKIRDACENVISNYPDCPAVKAARIMRKQWAHAIGKAAQK